MAIFNINIQNTIIAPSEHNLYYGTVNTIPTIESEVIALNSKQLNKKQYSLDFTNQFNKHIIALPSFITPTYLLNINNLSEELSEIFNTFTTTNIIQQSIPVEYNIYVLQTDIPYENNFNLFLELPIQE